MSDLSASHWTAPWLALLACPDCQAPLKSGGAQRIRCTHCGRDYPLLTGVPSLLLDQTDTELRTQELYGDIWEVHRRSSPKGRYRAAASSHIDLLRMASGSELVQGRTGIDAGCGDGSGVLNLARRHPHVRFLGLDLAAGIRKTAGLAADVANVRFVQGNLLRPPLASHGFDFAYSFGVLHHTRDPRSAFLSLVEKVRPGGRITIFVYKDFSDLPWKRLLLKPVTLLRRVSTKLPPSWLRALGWFGCPWVFLLLTLPARGLRAVGLEPMARHIPYGTFPGPRTIAASLEDRFGAPYEHRFRISDLEEWGRAARLKQLRAVDCLPWGFSGLVLSGLAPS